MRAEILSGTFEPLSQCWAGWLGLQKGKSKRFQCIACFARTHDVVSLHMTHVGRSLLVYYPL
jgi:hypothetical protein